MSALPPGSTIGVMGGGQLGRMMALAAARLGYRVHVFTPEADSPTEQVCDAATIASFDDEAALKAFAASVDAVTLEFENVPVAAVNLVAETVPVRPGARVLEVAQDRMKEKSLARELSIPVAGFEAVTSDTDLDDAIRTIGTPAVLKTRREGYDGKGQRKIEKPEEAIAAFEALGRQPAILEAFVSFESEISVIAVRSVDGDVRTYTAVENRHKHHILDLTIAPAVTPGNAANAAQIAAKKLAEELEVVGVLAVEFFVTSDGGILFNEMAPRPHNSGHWTIEACRVSQFEQQVRATVGLTPGPTGFHHRAVMRNLIGNDALDWEMLADSDASLHLYGKAEARAGRKMGHVTKLYAPDRPTWPPNDSELP